MCVCVCVCVFVVDFNFILFYFILGGDQVTNYNYSIGHLTRPLWAYIHLLCKNNRLFKRMTYYLSILLPPCLYYWVF
jgi:hypothetical protein